MGVSVFSQVTHRYQPEKTLEGQGLAPEFQAALLSSLTWPNGIDLSLHHGKSMGFLGQKCLCEEG